MLGALEYCAEADGEGNNADEVILLIFSALSFVVELTLE